MKTPTVHDSYATGWLPVSGSHRIYYEESGNPTGLPVVYLHGGPGSGCNPDLRDLFDASVYRLVLFDQRGSGKSLPAAGEQSNNTWRLLDDIESLREHLNIEQWVVAGGSWGATLGALYASAFPEKILLMILRGVFLGRQKDLDWFFGPEGVALEYPEAYQSLLSIISPEKRCRPTDAYYDAARSTDFQIAAAAAIAWSEWERVVAGLKKTGEVNTESINRRQVQSLKVMTHYVFNRFFFGTGGVLDEIVDVINVPGVIVHGSEDRVCLPQSALELRQYWPGVELEIVEGAGHVIQDPLLRKAFVAALERATGKLSRQT